MAYFLKRTLSNMGINKNLLETMHYPYTPSYAGNTKTLSSQYSASLQPSATKKVRKIEKVSQEKHDLDINKSKCVLMVRKTHKVALIVKF